MNFVGYLKNKVKIFLLMDFMYIYYDIKINSKLYINISFRCFIFSIYLTANVVLVQKT